MEKLDTQHLNRNPTNGDIVWKLDLKLQNKNHTDGTKTQTQFYSVQLH